MKNEFQINQKYAGLYETWTKETGVPTNEKALENFLAKRFPTLKDEEWRFTNVSPILKKDFTPATGKEKFGGDFQSAKNENLFGKDYYLLVIENGYANTELSNTSGLPNGTIISGLKEAKEKHRDIVEKYIGKAAKNKSAFDLLNNLFGIDGAFIYVPDGVILDKPVQVLFLSGNEKPLMISPRNLIVAEKNSDAKIIFTYAGKGEYFLNYRTEVFAGENASLQLYEFEAESETSYHLGSTTNALEENSNFAHYTFDLEGKFIRNDLSAELNGENIECRFYGFYIGKDERLIDNHTFINHNKPNCFSDEIYKGILDENSKAVFSGKIFVEKDAQKTNAYQSNKTILLSDNARIDTKPQLEIYADDVVCTHGATVGQLDKEMMFYIISRGIPQDKAQTMLIKAFAADVLDKIKIEKLGDFVNSKILDALEK